MHAPASRLTHFGHMPTRAPAQNQGGPLEDTPLEHIRSQRPFSLKGRIPAGLFVPVPGGRGWLRAKLNSSHFKLIEPRDSSEGPDDLTDLTHLDLTHLGPSSALPALRADGRTGNSGGGATGGVGGSGCGGDGGGGGSGGGSGGGGDGGGISDRAQAFLSSGLRAGFAEGADPGARDGEFRDRDAAAGGNGHKLPDHPGSQVGAEFVSSGGIARGSGSGQSKGGDGGDGDDGDSDWLAGDDARALADAFGY